MPTGVLLLAIVGLGISMKKTVNEVNEQAEEYYHEFQRKQRNQA